MADTFFLCINSGQATVTATITASVTLPVTSLLLNSSTGLTEAAVIMADSSGFTSLQTFLGTVSGNVVTFNNVLIPPSQSVQGFPAPYTFLITNIRVNATAADSGFPGHGITEHQRHRGSKSEFCRQQCRGAAKRPRHVASLRRHGFRLRFAHYSIFAGLYPELRGRLRHRIQDQRRHRKYHARIVADQQHRGRANMFRPLSGPNTVSNQATAATRLRVIFNNVPASVNIYVPGTVTSGGLTMRLTANEQGPISLLPNGATPTGYTGSLGLVAVAVTDNTGEAVYEVMTADNNGVDTASIPVYLTSTSFSASAGPLTADHQSGAGKRRVESSGLSDRSQHDTAQRSRIPGRPGDHHPDIAGRRTGPALQPKHRSHFRKPSLCLEFGWIVALGSLAECGDRSDHGNAQYGPVAGSFSVVVTDSRSLTASEGYALTIHQHVSITASSLPAGVVNQSYGGATLSAADGVGTYTWAVSGGNFPGGLSLAPSTGVISGTPTSSGHVHVQHTGDRRSGSRQHQVVFHSDQRGGQCQHHFRFPQRWSTSPIRPQQLQASGGAGGNTWSITGGSLAGTGLSLNANGSLSGTPLATGPITFTVQVKDQGNATASRQLVLTVNPTLAVTTTSLPAGTKGTNYFQSLAATGGSGSNQWTVQTGALPAGITLSSAGQLSGASTVPGTFTFTAQVTDSFSETAASQTLTLVMNSPLSIQSTTFLPPGVQGTLYNRTVSTSGASGSVTWSGRRRRASGRAVSQRFHRRHQRDTDNAGYSLVYPPGRRFRQAMWLQKRWTCVSVRRSG